jgi:hypothetical protein
MESKTDENRNKQTERLVGREIYGQRDNWRGIEMNRETY